MDSAVNTAVTTRARFPLATDASSRRNRTWLSNPASILGLVKAQRIVYIGKQKVFKGTCVFETTRERMPLRESRSMKSKKSERGKKRNASQRSGKPVFQAEQYSAISVQYTAEPLIKHGQRERGIRKKKKLKPWTIATKRSQPAFNRDSILLHLCAKYSYVRLSFVLIPIFPNLTRCLARALCCNASGPVNLWRMRRGSAPKPSSTCSSVESALCPCGIINALFVR